ncbi:MAG: HD domain-containing protein [Blautia sp.]|nr:HD domain-containing protein [Blautia sp.]
MNTKSLLEILKVAGRLKAQERHCTIREGRAESVADHSYRLALFAMLVAGEEEFSSLDRDKLLRMCLIHDLGEAFTGDIPTFLKTELDAGKEDAIFERWVSTFPSPQREEWEALLLEMKEQQTKEAKLYKALDKLEALISHNESDISTWLPLEYDLQFTYGQKECSAFSYLTELRRDVDDWSRRKIEEEKKDVDADS